jgi:hypothetical protein
MLAALARAAGTDHPAEAATARAIALAIAARYGLSPDYSPERPAPRLAGASSSWSYAVTVRRLSGREFARIQRTLLQTVSTIPYACKAFWSSPVPGLATLLSGRTLKVRFVCGTRDRAAAAAARFIEAAGLVDME